MNDRFPQSGWSPQAAPAQPRVAYVPQNPANDPEYQTYLREKQRQQDLARAQQEATQRQQAETSTSGQRKEPLFRFLPSDSAYEIAQKLNHNFDMLFGTPEQAGPGTYTRETLHEYHVRKSNEAVARKQEEDERAAAAAYANADPSYARQRYGDIPSWDAFNASQQRRTAAPPPAPPGYGSGAPGMVAPSFQL